MRRIKTKRGGILLLDAERNITAIDPNTGKFSQSCMISEMFEPASLLIESTTIAYVTSNSDDKLRKVELATGQVLQSMALGYLATRGGSVSSKQMLLIEDKLLVQIQRKNSSNQDEPGALVVIDTKNQ